MAGKDKRETYRVVVGNKALSGPMEIADAHNYALTVGEQDGLVEVVETYEWFCMKCGDDYWSMLEETYNRVKAQPRWRCNTCVWGWL